VELKLTQDIERMRELQDVFYASHNHALLIVPSRDGYVREGRSHQACDVWPEPQGVQVTSFKQPSQEEMQHDFFGVQ